jgi:CheY-like chemotaxis protein
MRRLTLIDVCADNRLLIQALLGTRYHITEYESGPPGLDGIRRIGADLVIPDISLPGMSGLEVLQHLKADSATSTIPVVALAATNVLTGGLGLLFAVPPGFASSVPVPA